MAGSVRIGISGWRYAPWRGVFYPEDLPQRRELEFASRTLSSIEINGTFYAMQKPESFEQWYRDTPEGFVFSMKGPRYISHIRRLREVERPLANFLASGLFNLRDKLGPILWQFPPNLRYDRDLFAHFLGLLPHDTEQALMLAHRHDEWMEGRARLAIDAKRPLLHAVEIRNASFAEPSFIALLREHGVALVVGDAAGRWPYLEDITAPFMYLRLHGEEELYAGGYTDAALDRWAARIDAWRQGREPEDARRVADASPPAGTPRDIYCYFDNDAKAMAPRDARRLMERMGAPQRARADAG